MDNKQILQNAPEGATHYLAVYGLYYKFIDCEMTVKAWIHGEWVDYPVYGAIQPLYNIAYIEALKERINELEKERNKYKEIARQHTEMASKGIYHTLDQLNNLRANAVMQAANACKIGESQDCKVYALEQYANKLKSGEVCDE